MTTELPETSETWSTHVLDGQQLSRVVTIHARKMWNGTWTGTVHDGVDVSATVLTVFWAADRSVVEVQACAELRKRARAAFAQEREAADLRQRIESLFS